MSDSGSLGSIILIVVVVIFAAFVVLPLIIARFLRDVNAGEVRLVSWLTGGTVIYRGPGKSKEFPLVTTGATIPSSAINVDLDITDQTADVDDSGIPRPIKVQVLASAIVSVGDSDEMIRTAANRFFSKENREQMSTLTDLLTSAGRRAINLLTHDQLFSAKTAPKAVAVAPNEDDDDPLAVIIRKACSRELTDLGLQFNSLNIKVVKSDVAEARRRQSAAEATANADIVQATQSRRAKEAQLEADRAISDKQRELAQTQASNAALVAQAEAKKQGALAEQRTAELQATQIAQAKVDAEKKKIDAEAQASAEAIRITKIADATAESIQKVNAAIQAGGEGYFRYKQLEMLPEIAPAIADALAQAKLVTISGGDANGGAAGNATHNIVGVMQAVLGAQIASQSLGMNGVKAPEVNPIAITPDVKATR